MQRRLLQQQNEDAAALRDTFAEGTPVHKQGLVATDDGANLRAKPDPGSPVLDLLPLNTPVFVDRQLPENWYFVTLGDGRTGYLPASRVNLMLPEPGARLHRIQPGESALEIVKKYYKGDAIKWGRDERFFVNVLVLVNQDTGRKGIFKPSAVADWSTTQTKAGSQIWIPSLEFAKTLQGKVSSGSLSYEVYSTLRDAAGAVGSFLLGAASFVGGLLHGALESIWDIFAGLADLAKLVWSILKSLFTGEILSDAKKLMAQIEQLKLKDLIELGLKALDEKWNAPSLTSRWHFRGWLIGYLIMEVLLMFVSGGALTALKWVGKAVKLEKLLAKLPKLAKLGEKVKTLSSSQMEKFRDAWKGLKQGRKEGALDEALELQAIFRRGGKLNRIKSVSLKHLRQALGRAGVSPSKYNLQKATKAELDLLRKNGGDPDSIFGWVIRDGEGNLLRDLKGRPVIKFTPKGLSSLEEAVKTFGHEAKHIKDFTAGMTTSSEALAELAGEKLWLLVSATLKH